nr:hypothetical protein OG409_04045 [Streptomyces sp. NBC_00974]
MREAAVRADAREVLVGAAGFALDLRSLTVPSRLSYAPRGRADEHPGMLPAPLVSHWSDQIPLPDVEAVPDRNHFTVVMGPATATIADRPAGRPPR